MTAIISDVHANYPALKAVMDDIQRRGIKKIFSLGDVCGYYSMINESIDLLKMMNVVNIRGNHDHYMIENEQCLRSNSVNKSLDFQRKAITDENFKWLTQSIPFHKDSEHWMVHGAFNDNGMDEYLYTINNDMFAACKEKYFFAGHTHVQTMIRLDKNRLFCNPGSVGQPRDGDKRAAYAVIDKGAVELIRMEYDIDIIADHMKKSGFEAYFYENLYAGTTMRGNILHISPDKSNR
jgi:predicted phosphodiesterase